MANKKKRKSKRGGCVSDRPGRPEKPKPALKPDEVKDSTKGREARPDEGLGG